nr:MAG TPA: hypothetical protein [Caudoviricetes sp.]
MHTRSAFNGSWNAGVRCPWRFGNLNNGTNAGLAYENGNNGPSNANWNGRPRLSGYQGGLPLQCVCISIH